MQGLRTARAEGRSVFTYAVLVLLAIAWLLPLLILINGALQGPGPIRFTLIPENPTLSNFAEVWRNSGLPRMLFNSALVTAVSTVAVLVITSLAGFGLAMYSWRWNPVLILFLLSGLLLAPTAIIVPLYQVVNQFGLLNNYFGLIGPYTALGLPVGTLLFRNGFRSIPREITFAARVDGASGFSLYRLIHVPLVKPTIATVAILQVLTSWNDYLLALLFMTDRDYYTSQLAFIAFTAQYLSSEQLQFAVMTLIMLPVLMIFLAAQRSFIRGLTAGAIKD